MTNEQLIDVLGTLDAKLMTAQWLAESASNRIDCVHTKTTLQKSKTTLQEVVRNLGILRAVLQNERGNVAKDLLKENN